MSNSSHICDQRSKHLRYFNGVAGRLSTAGIGIVDQVVVSGTSLAMTVLVGRFAGLDQLGMLALCLAVLVLISAINDALISSPYAVFAGQERGQGRRVYAGSTLCQAGLLVFLLLATLLAVRAWQPVGTDSVAHLILSGTLIAAPAWMLRDCVRRWLLAHLKMMRVLVLDTASSLLLLLGLVWLTASGRLSVISALSVLALAWGGVALTFLIWHRRLFTFRRSAWSGHWRRNIGFGRWVLGEQCVDVVCGYGPHWMLAALVGTAATGTLHACLSIAYIVNPLLQSLAGWLVPYLSRKRHHKGTAGLILEARLITFALIGVLVAFGVVITLLGDQLLKALYGQLVFAQAGLLFFVLAVGRLASGIRLVARCSLRALEKPQLNLAASLASLATLTVASMLLAPEFGLAGVVVAMVAGGGLAAAITWHALWRVTAEARQPRPLASPVVASHSISER